MTFFFFFCEQLRPWAKARHICWVLSQLYVIFDLFNNQWSSALKEKSMMQLVEPVLLCWVNHDGQTCMLTSKLHPSPWNYALSWTLDLECALFLFLRPTERERTECLIKSKLRSIMMCQDLENVTSKEVSRKCRMCINTQLHTDILSDMSRQTHLRNIWDTLLPASSNVSRLTFCDQIFRRFSRCG